MVTADTNTQGGRTTIRKALVVAGTLIVAGLVSGTTPARADVDPGEPFDGVPDLRLDAGTGELVIDTDGTTIDGYLIKSATGMFTGDPANNLGWFREDSDAQICGFLGFTLNGTHDLGDVVGPDWLYPPPQWNLYYDDFTYTYTQVGMAGEYEGNLIVTPEPATLALLAAGGMAMAIRRRKALTR